MVLGYYILAGLLKVLATDQARPGEEEAVLQAFRDRLKRIVKGEAISDSTMF